MCQQRKVDSSMNRKRDLVEKAELAARETIKEWIRRTLRESFLQALRQVWKIRHKENQTSINQGDSSPSSEEEPGESRNKIQVELSLSGVNACFSFVERVSRAWQTKLKEEHHERVAGWVAEIYQEGKSSLWIEQQTGENDNDDSDSEKYLNNASANEQPQNQQLEKKTCSKENDGTTQETAKSLTETIGDDDNDDVNGDYEESDSMKDCHDHHSNPNVYCKLRALGRRRKIDSPVLSIPDALNEIKEFTRNQSTYWPLENDIIDRACLDMSRRMRVRDTHGSGIDGGKSLTKKTVRFKVLPKSVWETKRQQEQNQTDESESNEPIVEGGQSNERNSRQTATFPTQGMNQESNVETMLLASMQRKKSRGRSHATSQTSRKRSRISGRQEIPRAPFDASSDGRIPMDLSLEDKKILDGLLILEDEARDKNGTLPATASMSEVPLSLFGGLQLVGQTNHYAQNPDTGFVGTFMARDTDKITRRKEKTSVQERLDPNRLQIGRDENPAKRKSKVLRTENWFDDQLKFIDFDLGWCLLEISTEGNQKRLCAFSSMEICLDDSD